jgi:hypothetical protein
MYWKKHETKLLMSVITILVVALAAVTVLLISNRKQTQVKKASVSNTTSIIVATGNAFPIATIYDSKGAEADFSQGKKKILAYMDQNCYSCIVQIPYAHRIANIFSGDEYSVHILWENAIPSYEGQNDEYDLTLNGKIQFAVPSPHVFVLDEDNVIRFSGNFSGGNLVQYLLRNSQHDYRDEAFVELARLAGLDVHTKQIFEFTSRGCRACENSLRETPILAKKAGFDHIIISEDELANEGLAIQDSDIFSTIFGIEYYPAYVFVDSQSDLIVTNDIEVAWATD